MKQTEDLVRSTTRALAGTVRAVRPLPPLPEAPSRNEVPPGAGPGRPGSRRWLPPQRSSSLPGAV